MRTRPTVSVVIPTRERDTYLPVALASVLSQGWDGTVEVLVVDNEASQKTSLLVSSSGPRVRYLAIPLGGRSAARNAGMEAATGDLIAFLDSDDQWLPGKLSTQIPFILGHPEIVLSYSRTEVIDAHGSPLPAWTASHRALYEQDLRRSLTYPELARRCTIFTSTVMCWKSVLEEVGGFDPSLEALEDLDLYLRLARQGDLAQVPGPPLVRYRVHPGQTASTESVRGRIAVTQKHLRLLEDSRPPWRSEAARHLRWNLADALYMAGEYSQSLRTLAELAAKEPLQAARPAYVRRVVRAVVRGAAVRPRPPVPRTHGGDGRTDPTS